MGNSQTALSGIHPFKDDSSPPHQFIPPAQFPNLMLPEVPLPLHQPVTSLTSNLSTVSNQPPAFSSQLSTASGQPQQLSLAAGWSSITADPQPEKFDDLFVVKAPTPPPRRISYNEQGKANRRMPKLGFLHRGFSSLRTLPRLISRPDIGKIRGFFRRKRVVGEVYPVPPDAEKPSPPSKPEVLHEQDEYFLLRWDPPAYDGGLPIIGYVIQHLELGLPLVDQTVEKDDTQSWFSSEPGQVTSTEVLLNNLIPGTTYQFRVIAENLLGFSQPSEISSPIVFNPNGELDDWFCPPVIIIPLDESYTVIEHERLVLVVEITGQPYPIVKWYGNDGAELGKVLDPVKYSVVSCGQRRVLTINAVDCGDSGVIRCVGENERGFVECSCVVVVEAPPHIRRVLRSDLIKLENPYELSKDEERLVRRQDKQDEELIFQSGEQARFKFLYSGSPAPNVCVYHEADLVDGEEVAGSGRMRHERVNTEITENLITVKIANVKRTDRGEWTVRLDNVLGEDATSVLVTISDRPSEPGRPDVLQLSDNTVILKWDKPFDDGGCPVSGYVVEYFRSEWGVWLKACTTKNPYTKIRDLIPGSKYMFRVKAENLYGMSDPSSHSVELLITDLASTLRSVTGDAENTLLMTTVVEEEEDAVKIEEEEPGRRLKQGSSISLNRVSAATMTDLSALGVTKGGTGDETQTEEDTEATSPQPSHPPPLQKSSSSPDPPRKTLRLESPPRSARTPSPSRLLKVTLQPQVVILDDEPDFFPGEDEDILIEPPPRRSPSPNILATAPIRRSPSPVAPPRTRTFIQQASNIDEEAIALTKSQEFSARKDVQENVASLFAPPVAPKRHHVTAQQPPQQPVPQFQATLSEPAPSQPPSLSPKPFTIPVVNPIVDQPKKLYSRSEIIKSAATNDLDFYYLSLTTEESPAVEDDRVEEPEEDPELLKVKEALSKDDHMFDDLEDEEDLEEYEYDFDKLQEEYEQDRKRGQVSRQDSGVSARSADQSSVSRGASFNEGEEEEGDERPRSVMSEVAPKKPVLRMGSFERAQSEVVNRDKRAFEFGSISGPVADVKVEEIEEPEVLVPPPVEPRRTMSPSPARSFGVAQQQHRGSLGARSQSQGGSKTMLHDRFTDYIAMKASSRNKAVGSSLRSLSSSRYSSNENMSRDSGRSSLEQGGGASRLSRGEQQDVGKFGWRQFDAGEECRAVQKLERSVSVGSRGLSIFHSDAQQRRRGGGEEEGQGGGELERTGVVKMEEENMGRSEDLEGRDLQRNVCQRFSECGAFISTPEIYSSERGEDARRFGGLLEHSRSESHMGCEEVPDSGLKERVLVHHAPGGVDYETEEESGSGVEDKGFSAISEEGEGHDGSGSKSAGDRDLPRDREGGRRLRKRVSFGSSDVEELSWDDGRGRGVRGAENFEREGDEREEDLGEGEEPEGDEVYEEEGQPGEEVYEEQEGEEIYEGDEERLEYVDEYGNVYLRQDDTHAGDDEFDDDGEVFEMDIEGIDPRVYAEEDAEIEGEEDSSSGVMYVLLEPEGVRIPDLSEFEGQSLSERDERIGNLLLKLDQFLEEGEGDEGGGAFVEEIIEEEQHEGEEDEEQLLLEEQEQKPETGEEESLEVQDGEFVENVEEVKEEEVFEVTGVLVLETVFKETTDDAPENEKQLAPQPLDSEVEVQPPEDPVKETTKDIPGEEQNKLEGTTGSEDKETIEEVAPVYQTEEKAPAPLEICRESGSTEPLEVEEKAPTAESIPEVIHSEEKADVEQAVLPAEEKAPETVEIQTDAGSETQEFQLIDQQLTKDEAPSEYKPSEQQEVDKKASESQETESITEADLTEQQLAIQFPIEPKELPEVATELKTEKFQTTQDLTSGARSSSENHPSIQDTTTPTATCDIKPPHQILSPPPLQQKKRDTPVAAPPPPPQPPSKPIPTLHHVETPESSSARVEPPPPPPRPTTFSYKQYMSTERHKQPPMHQPHVHHRSHSREQSITALPTVKEEPANRPSTPSSRPQSPISYKPNMSAYQDIRQSTSLRSSTSTLYSSQDLPRSFRSPTEDSDPPVTIEEIRARIEQQRLELLKPLLRAKEEQEEAIVTRRRRSVKPETVEAPISPFMNYLFNAAFYLMLSPMLFFVDSLYFGLLALLLVACVHFFVIRH